MTIRQEDRHEHQPLVSEADTAPGGKPRMRWAGAGLHRLWSDRWLGLMVAVLLAAAFALLSAWITPRGPITTTEALVSMAAALAVGAGAGLVMGNRWSMLAAPVAFGVVFELARMGAVGPTVDAITVGSFYGIVALVLGRGVHGLLVLGPIVLGAV